MGRQENVDKELQLWWMSRTSEIVNTVVSFPTAIGKALVNKKRVAHALKHMVGYDFGFCVTDDFDMEMSDHLDLHDSGDHTNYNDTSLVT